MRLSGAEILARILIEQGVDTIFGYPGGAVLPIYDALYDHQDEITHYITAHEQGAAHAADGYARSTGKVGVVLATSGPGATNIVTGIAAAFMDSIPLIAITGNVGTPFIGKDSFQEVYTTGITLPITKHNFSVQDVSELAPTLREAFAIASSGRKGPVLIDITKDAQAAWCEFQPASGASASGASASGASASGTSASGAPASGTSASEVPESGVFETRLRQESRFSQADIEAAVSSIVASRKPLVVFGGGITSANACEELTSFLQRTRIPASHTLMGTGVLDNSDPLNLGLIGMHGKLSVNRALDKADLVLALGFRFSDRVVLNAKLWGSQAHIIQVDIDRSEIDKNVEADQAIIGDVRDVLGALTDELSCVKKTLDTEVWLARIHEWQADDRCPSDDGATLKPHQVIRAIAEEAGEELIITTDVGQHQMWAAQYCQRLRPRSFITSGGLGAMGFGYGAAIGAQIGAAGKSRRIRPVVHITGDGSFHMNLNEACTAVSYHLPIITIIFNNRALGMVRQWQKTFYDARYIATTLDRVTDFTKVAEGFGLTGMRARTIADFRAAFLKALKIDGPVWIECLIDCDELVVPMLPTGGTVEDTILD